MDCSLFGSCRATASVLDNFYPWHEAGTYFKICPMRFEGTSKRPRLKLRRLTISIGKYKDNARKVGNQLSICRVEAITCFVAAGHVFQIADTPHHTL